MSQIAAVYVEVIRTRRSSCRSSCSSTCSTSASSKLTVAWLAVTVWGGLNTENFRAGFEAVPARYREAGRTGVQGFATFVNITLPIGGRIALPSSINTYISIVKNTSLMYVIAYPEITTTIYQIQALTLETAEAFTVLALTYLIIVVPVGAHSIARVAPGAPGGSAMSTPDWSSRSPATCSEVALANTLAVGDRTRGQLADRHRPGTLLTIHFLPLRAVIRAYIEIWRGLPILVTIFIVYFALPSVRPTLRFDSITAGAIALILWGSAQAR